MLHRLILILLSLSITLGDEGVEQQVCMTDSSLCHDQILSSQTPPLHSNEEPSLDELTRQLIEARNRVQELEASIRRLGPNLHPISSNRKGDDKRASSRIMSRHPLNQALASWLPDEEAIRVARGGGSVPWSSFFQLLATPTLSPSPSSPPTIFHYFNDPVEQWNSMSGKKGPMPSAKRAGGKPFDPPGQILVGDTQGRVMVYNPLGRLIMTYETGSSSKVTAMTSYSLKRNESVLVTGHEDGEISIHLVSESYDMALREQLISSISHFHTLPPPPSDGEVQASSSRVSLEVTHLSPYRMKGKANGNRMFAAADASGRIRLISDTDGVARYSGDGGQGRLLAMQISGNVLIGMGVKRAVVVNLMKPSPPSHLGQSSHQTHRPRTLDCFKPQNPVKNESTLDADEIKTLAADSSLISVAFDPILKFRGYGWTDKGKLAAFYIPHDTKPFSCKLAKVVRPLVPASLDSNSLSFEPGSVALSALRGHLFVSLSSRVLLFNVTLFSQDRVNQIISMPSTDLISGDDQPLAVGSDLKLRVTVVGNSNLLVISSPDNSSFTFHSSHLPIPRGMTGEPPSLGLRGMQQVAFLVIMIFVGVFQFFKARSRKMDLGGVGRGRGVRGGRSFLPSEDDDDLGLEELEAKLGLKRGGGALRRGEDDDDDSEGDDEIRGMIGSRGLGSGLGQGGRGGIRRPLGGHQGVDGPSDMKWGTGAVAGMRNRAGDAAKRGPSDPRGPIRVRGKGVSDASRWSYGERLAQIERTREVGGGGGGEVGGAFPVRSSMRAARMGPIAEREERPDAPNLPVTGQAPAAPAPLDSLE